MARWFRRWKPFGSLMVTASGRPLWKNGNKRPMPPNTLVRNRPAMKVKAYAAHTGLLSLRILNVSLLLPSSMWTTVGESPPHVPPGLPSTPQSSWQPCTDANASRSSWVFRKYEKQLSARRQARRWFLNRWTYLHRLYESYLSLHIPFNMRLYPNDFLCRAQTMKSSLVMTKTSRPYEMGILCGEYLIRRKCQASLSRCP